MDCGRCTGRGEGKWIDFDDHYNRCFSSPALSPECRPSVTGGSQNLWEVKAATGQKGLPCAQTCHYQMCKDRFDECKAGGATAAGCQRDVKEFNQCRGCELVRCDPQCWAGGQSCGDEV
jgi:hypothetical protein